MRLHGIGHDALIAAGRKHLNTQLRQAIEWQELQQESTSWNNMCIEESISLTELRLWVTFTMITKMRHQIKVVVCA